jgi:hypothetical protein
MIHICFAAWQCQQSIAKVSLRADKFAGEQDADAVEVEER